MHRLAHWFAVSALALTACNGQIVADDGDAVGQALRTQCSEPAYAAASAAYGRAVAWASARLSEGVCESEHGMLWGIADETAAAISACEDFRPLVRSAHSAAPLHAALDRSLTMASLSGELRAGSASITADWSGVEALIAKGVTFWARAQGAYGSQIVIDFVGVDRIAITRLVDLDNEIVQEKLDGTYAIERAAGTEAGSRIVHVTFEGTTTDYVLDVQMPAGKAPVFLLTPTASDAPALYSLVGECDA